MGRLIIFDTSNFSDWPVGGQLTSISNFLRFLSEDHPDRKKDVLLVGVTVDRDTPGTVKEGPYGFPFLPVLSLPREQSDIQHSVRLEYLKGLIRHRNALKVKAGDCCYIHTPEAYAAIRLMSRKAPCFVFSHGTYGNMWKRVRFFKKFPLVRLMFQKYLMDVIRGARAVFVLDSDSVKDYRGKAKRIVFVRNSGVRDQNPHRTAPGDPVRCLYAGRLSKVKNIGPIIDAFSGDGKIQGFSLTVAGAGEEEKDLRARADSGVTFTGPLSPEETRDLMRASDILVMNSVFEGMPMSVIEAMCVGLPVVTTDAGGIGENLRFGTGCELTDGTPEGIKAALRKVVSDYARYSEEAWEYSGIFDYRTVNRRIFRVLNRELGWE